MQERQGEKTDSVRRSDKHLGVLTNDGAKRIETMLDSHQGRGGLSRRRGRCPGRQTEEVEIRKVRVPKKSLLIPCFKRSGVRSDIPENR
jgi:hypothetical protein